MPWHNNHIFDIVNINNRVKKCAGCSLEFFDPSGPLFIGVVVRHVERDYYPDPASGQQKFGREVNKYYHCQPICLLYRHPHFNVSLLRIDAVLNSVQVDHIERVFNIRI
jgi:hypothetical protein